MRTLHELVAFCARYGHQPLSELWPLTRRDACEFAEAIGKLIEQEAPSLSPGDR